MPKVSAAAVYARISSDQDGGGLGVARQIKECRQLAVERGWPVCAEFVDNDVSAFSGKRRPEYERLLEAIRGGWVDAVIVYHLDRLTRRPRELEEFVEVCDRAGIKHLGTVAGDVNIGSGDGLLVARIQAAVAANESASKSRRLRSKWLQVAESGMPHLGSHRAFGYEGDGLTIVADEATILRECAERVSRGESVRSVAVWLNDRGVKTAGGGPWRTASLRDALTNPRMIGMRSYRGEIITTAAWEPILADDVQARVIARIEARSASGRRAPRRYLLSGLLRCGRCGRTLYSSAYVDTRRYVCQGPPDHDGCGKLAVAAVPLEQFISDAVVCRLLEHEDMSLTGQDPTVTGSRAVENNLAADEALRDALGARYADDQITARDWIVQRNPVDVRIREGRRHVAERTEAATLRSLAGGVRDLRVSWAGLTLPAQTAIVRSVLVLVVIAPATKRIPRLDPDRVHPEWRL